MSQDTDGQILQTEGNTVESMPNSEQPIEQPGDQQGTNNSTQNDVNERTREQFEKLTASNKALAEKVAAYEQQNSTANQPKFSSVLDEVKPIQKDYSNLSATQVNDIAATLEDKDGYIDPDLLNKTLSEANQRATRAEERASIAEARIDKFEETQLVRDVHSKHPALDPYNQAFNQTFYNAVKNEVVGQLKKGYQDYAAAADKVATELRLTRQGQTQEKASQEVENQKIISQREQASVLTTTSKGASKPVEYDRLVSGTRAGDTLSIGQRLQASGH